MMDLKFQNLSRTGIINRIVFAAGIVIVVILSIFISPNRLTFSTCLFHDLTGHSCPTCGLTRSFYAVAHFKIADAISFHRMGPVLYLILLLLLLKFISELILKKAITIRLTPGMSKLLVTILFGLWMFFWISRLVTE